MDLKSCLMFLVCYLVAGGTVEGGGTVRYLIYSVKAGEGFNLRRDVFMRAAVLVKALRDERKEDWVLVLSPWPHLYHWKSKSIKQNNIKWNFFFDLPSLNKYVPVIEFEDYIKREGKKIEEVIKLQLPASLDQEGAKTIHCIDRKPFIKTSSGTWKGTVFGVADVAVRSYHCLEVLGFAKTLMPEIIGKRSVLVERMGVVMHTDFNGVEYWLSRASMVYAEPLREVGDRFMESTFGYDPRIGNGRGRDHVTSGNYLSVHLRREDYKHARPESVPSLRGAANQINQLKRLHGLEKVFLSTDAPIKERVSLAKLVDGLVWYAPTHSELQRYGDGGVAIIDQWIASHAKFFVGSAESTFSFRIREDRQFMGFSEASTYNNLCGDHKIHHSGKDNDRGDCSKATYWKMPTEVLVMLLEGKNKRDGSDEKARQEL